MRIDQYNLPDINAYFNEHPEEYKDFAKKVNAFAKKRARIAWLEIEKAEALSAARYLTDRIEQSKRVIDKTVEAMRQAKTDLSDVRKNIERIDAELNELKTGKTEEPETREPDDDEVRKGLKELSKAFGLDENAAVELAEDMGLLKKENDKA